MSQARSQAIDLTGASIADITISAKKVGRKDFLGFYWWAVYEDGKPVIEQGVHVKYKAKDEGHAIACHNQLSQVRQAQ